MAIAISPPFISVTVINTMAKSNWGRKGFISSCNLQYSIYIIRKIAYKMGLLSVLGWNVGTEAFCACSVVWWPFELKPG